MSIQGMIDAVRKEFDGKLRELRNELHTFANGGAVSIREVTPAYGTDLKRVERFNVVERRVLDPDQVLISKAEFEALHQKLDVLTQLARFVPVIDELKNRAEKADALAFQTFMSLASICDSLGLHVRIAPHTSTHASR